MSFDKCIHSGNTTAAKTENISVTSALSLLPFAVSPMQAWPLKATSDLLSVTTEISLF